MVLKIQREKNGRFAKGHGWEDSVIKKISQTKTIYASKFSNCENCRSVFIFKPNKHHLKRRFCSRPCVNAYGGRRGIPLSEKSALLMSKKMSGENNHRYVDGSSAFRGKFIKSRIYRKWRTSVFTRDNFTCQMCKQRGGKLNADHIVPWSESVEKRLDLDNGRTLCVDCHKIITTIWLKSNWKNQY